MSESMADFGEDYLTSEDEKEEREPVVPAFDPEKVTMRDVEVPWEAIARDSGTTLEKLGEAEIYSAFTGVSPDEIAQDIETARSEHQANPRVVGFYTKSLEQTQIQNQIAWKYEKMQQGQTLTPSEEAELEQLEAKEAEVGEWLKANDPGGIHKLLATSFGSLTPTMYEGLKYAAPKAATGMAAGMAITAMTGPAAPYTGGPLVTASGAAFGTWGFFEHAKRNAAGNSYREQLRYAKETGLPFDEKRAQLISEVSGNIQGLFEVANVGVALKAPGLVPIMTKMGTFLSRSIAHRVVGQFLGRSALTWGEETMVEGFQDATNMVAQEVTKYLNNIDFGANYKLKDVAEMLKESASNLWENAKIMGPLAVFSGLAALPKSFISNKPGKFVKVDHDPNSLAYTYSMYDTTSAADSLMEMNEGRLEDLGTLIKDTSGAMELPEQLVVEAHQVISGAVLNQGVSNREDLVASMVEAMPDTMDYDRANGIVAVLEHHANYLGEDLETFIMDHLPQGVVQGVDADLRPAELASRRIKEEIAKQDADKPAKLKKSEAQVKEYLDATYNSEDSKEYFKECRRFMSRMGSLARQGQSALAANNKTIMSIDVSTYCPYKTMGSPCIYCYVEQPRTWYEKLGRKLNSNPKGSHQFIPYNSEILEMPQELVDFFNSIGGMRMFSFGDFRIQDSPAIQNILADAKTRGLTVKAITKQKEFLNQINNKDVLVDISTDFDPDHADAMLNETIRKIEKTKPDGISEEEYQQLKVAAYGLREAFKSPSYRGMVSRAMSPSEAADLKANNKNVAVRYVAMNKADAIKAIMNPKYDVVTLYHGFTKQQYLMDIWREQNPDLFKNLGDRAVSVLANMFEAPKTKTFTEPSSKTMKMVHEITGDSSITEKEFTQNALKKLCCQKSACGRCATCCGFKRGEGLQILNQFLEGEVRASIEFDADNRALIRAFKAAELADMVHEVGHLFRRTMRPAELQRVEQIFGVEKGQWTEEKEEAFARAFERYVATGKVKNPALKKTFEKLRQWMAHLYSSIVRSSIKVSPELEAIFDKILGSEIKQPRPAHYQPRKSVVAYRLVQTYPKERPGMMFPLYMDDGTPIDLGEWNDARLMPKRKGFAPRQGWHSGAAPSTRHLAMHDQKGNPRIWTECEISADEDWQPAADASPTKDLPWTVPERGYYLFPRPFNQGGQWFISGSVRVNRTLSEEEANEITEAIASGKQPQFQRVLRSTRMPSPQVKRLSGTLLSTGAPAHKVAKISDFLEKVNTRWGGLLDGIKTMTYAKLQGMHGETMGKSIRLNTVDEFTTGHEIGEYLQGGSITARGKLREDQNLENVADAVSHILMTEAGVKHKVTDEMLFALDQAEKLLLPYKPSVLYSRREPIAYKNDKQYARDVDAELAKLRPTEEQAARASAQREARYKAAQEVREQNPPPSTDMEFFKKPLAEQRELMEDWRNDLNKKIDEAIEDLPTKTLYSRRAKNEKNIPVTSGGFVLPAPDQADKGVVFIGADGMGADIEGNPSPFESFRYPEKTMAWTASKSIATLIDKYAKEGYKYVAVVTYKHVRNSMRNHPHYRAALRRALVREHGEEKTKQLLEEGAARVADMKAKGKFLNTNAEYEAAVKNLKAGATIDVARQLIVEDWKTKAGKIVGIGIYGGIDPNYQKTGKAGEVYDSKFTFSAWHPLPKPIGFSEFMNTMPQYAEKTGPWMTMNQRGFVMNKKDHPMVQTLMAAAHGDFGPVTQFLETSPELTPEVAKNVFFSRRPPIKSRVLRVTGVKKISDIMVAEEEALKGRMKGEEMAAKAGAKEAKKETTKAMKQEFAERNWFKKQLAYLKGAARLVRKGEMNPPQQEALEELFKGIDFTKPSKATVMNLNRLRNYLASDPNVELSEDIQDELGRLDKTPLIDMTIDELNTVITAVKHHIHLARQIRNVTTALGRMKTKEAANRIIGELKTGKVDPNKVVGDVKISAEIVAGAKFLKRYVHHYDMMVEELSQLGPGGTLYDIFVRQITEGEKTALKYQQDASRMVFNEVEAFGKANNIKDVELWLDENREVTLQDKHTGADTKISISRNEILGIYRHSLNTDNRNAMLKGGIGFKDKELKNRVYRVTDEWLDSLVGSLTAAEIQFATGRIDEMFDLQYNKMAKVFYRKNGYLLEQVKNYYPKDVVAIERGEKDLESDLVAEISKGKTVRVGVPKGMINKRIGSQKAIYIRPFTDVVHDSIVRASNYIGLELPLTNAAKMLYGQPQLRAEMEERFGTIRRFGGAWNQIERGLQDVAGVNHSTEIADMVAGWFRQNMATGKLGLSIFTMLRQISGFPLYMKDVPVINLMKGLIRTTTNYSDIIEQHEENSPMFFERVRGGYSRDINDAIRKIDKHDRIFKDTGLRRWFGKGGWRQTVMRPTQTIDKITVAMGMEAAKDYVLSMFKSGSFEPRVLERIGITQEQAQAMAPQEKLAAAYRYADWVTTQTQPVSSKIYRSGLSRGGNLLRLMTMFTEQTNALMNMWSQAVNETIRTGNKRPLAATFVAMAFNSAWQVAVGNLLRGALMKDDYEPDWGQILTDFIGDMVFGPIYFAPDIWRLFTVKGAKYEHPLYATGKRIFAGISRIYNSFQERNLGKASQDLETGIMLLAGGAGDLSGIPLGPLMTMYKIADKVKEKVSGE